MEELISVVVPIYKVEQYLRECVDSILKQTYTKIEVILVDDGSPDQSGKICDEYQERDNRVYAIHKENGGLSDARNAGLHIAKGKYICFIDSDDIIHPTYIEVLYRLITKYHASIAVCDFARISSTEEIEQVEIGEEQEFTLSKQEAICNIYHKKLYVKSIVAWNKLYDISLFDEIQFAKGKLHEDEFTTYKLYYNSDTIAVTSKKLYYYRYNPKSIMNQSFNIKRLDGLEAMEERLAFFKEKKEENLYHLTLIQYESTIMIHYMNCKLRLEESKEIQKELLEKYRKNYHSVIQLSECTWVNKIKFTIAYVSPNLYYATKKIAKKVIGLIRK